MNYHEKQRGCGYAIVNGFYLVGKGMTGKCDILPLQLSICPTCGAGVKRSRGIQWISSDFFKDEIAEKCNKGCGFPGNCPFQDSGNKIGLFWVGTQFYPTPEDFIKEAQEQGVSKRIPRDQIPRELKIGESHIVLAHQFACRDEDGNTSPGVFFAFKPEAVEKIITEDMDTEDERLRAKRKGYKLSVVEDNPRHRGSAYNKANSGQKTLF